MHLEWNWIDNMPSYNNDMDAPDSVSNKSKWATEVVVHIVMVFIYFEISVIPKL